MSQLSYQNDEVLILTLSFDNGVEVAIWQKYLDTYTVETVNSALPYESCDICENLTASEVFSYLADLQNKKL